MFPGQTLAVQGDPFQESINNLPGQPGEYANLSVTVSPDRTLVATNASVRVQVPTGQAVYAALTANGPPGLIVGTLHFVLALQGTFNGFDVFTAAESTLLWMWGPYGGFTVVRNSTSGQMSCEVAVSGFLLP
jgi:hypothetical protein